MVEHGLNDKLYNREKADEGVSLSNKILDEYVLDRRTTLTNHPLTCVPEREIIGGSKAAAQDALVRKEGKNLSPSEFECVRAIETGLINGDATALGNSLKSIAKDSNAMKRVADALNEDMKRGGINVELGFNPISGLAELKIQAFRDDYLQWQLEFEKNPALLMYPPPVGHKSLVDSFVISGAGELQNDFSKREATSGWFDGISRLFETEPASKVPLIARAIRSNFNWVKHGQICFDASLRM